MTDFTDIDTMAVAGYQYATNTGQSRSVAVETEMDLLAFNAGISNANVRHDLAVAKISRLGSIQIKGSEGDVQLLLTAMVAKVRQLAPGKELACNSLQLLGRLVDYNVWLAATKALESAGVIESKLVANGYGGKDLAYFVVDNTAALQRVEHA